MAEPRRSVEEIVQYVLSREALHNPRMRGMVAVLVGSAAALTFLVVADFYAWPAPFSFEGLGLAGSPYRPLLAIAVASEGVIAAVLLMRHREPPYPALTQAAAATLAGVGLVAVGLGTLLYLLWTSALAGYFAGAEVVSAVYYLLLLAGSAWLLAALPAIAPSLLRPLIAEDA